jgi:Holliday junction resolvase RusA-like endonuclease
MILTKEARDWKQLATLIIRRDWPKTVILVPTVKHQLHIIIKCYMENWRRDASNCTKQIKDVMEKIVYTNDRLVHLDYLDVSLDKANPRVELTIPINIYNKATMS